MLRVTDFGELSRGVRSSNPEAQTRRELTVEVQARSMDLFSLRLISLRLSLEIYPVAGGFADASGW